MNRLVLAVAVAAVSVASLAAQDAAAVFSDVKQYIQQGEKSQDMKATLTISMEAVTVARNVKDVTVIPFAQMTGATYDRRARQRKVMGFPQAGWQPKVQHFLTIKYKAGAAGEFVELELGKDIAARVVSTLEARSGQTLEKTGS
jgi:Ni/Co efflux regulator RcnB